MRTVSFERLVGHGVDEAVERVLADVARKTRLDGLGEGHALDLEDVDVVDGVLDVTRRLRGDLASVGTVGFVAVVGSGVMAGRHADAHAAPKVAHGEAQRRRGLDARVDERADAVGRQHTRCGFDELLAHVAAVARDGDARVGEVRVNVIGEALRGLRDGVDVHAVRARADDAAQACRAEGEILVEGVADGGFIPRLQLLELGEQSGVVDVVDPKFEQPGEVLHVGSFLFKANQS